ncbi:MAG: hypothetical protein WB711_00675 [Terriglobales bacterium]
MAVAKVCAGNPPIGLQLKAGALDYVMWGGVAVTVFVVERTPALMQLHEKVIAAVEPFSVSGGTKAAFVGDDANSDTIGWVEHFIPDSRNRIPFASAFAPASSSAVALLTSETVMRMLLERPKAKLLEYAPHCHKLER